MELTIIILLSYVVLHMVTEMCKYNNKLKKNDLVCATAIHMNGNASRSCFVFLLMIAIKTASCC